MTSFALLTYNSPMDKKSELEKVHGKWKEKCQCELKKTATQAVPGDGSAEAEIVFIGEAPGKKEDELGRPFVGAAGKFLAEMLSAIKLAREDIYITNIVKYRPNFKSPWQTFNQTICRHANQIFLCIVPPCRCTLRWLHARNSHE